MDLAPHTDPAPRSGLVQLWHIPQGDAAPGPPPPPLPEPAAQVLSQGELERAGRYHRQIHRDRFLRAHVALREILSGALELEPSAIQYELNPQGKPRLGGPAAAAGLHFNLSGTAGLSLVALSWDGPLGVDVERHRDDRSLLDVAERYFSAAEVGSLRALEPAVQLEAFHRIWTRKEAYIKAVGLGLSMELASFDVSHDAGAGARLLATRPDAAAAERWRLADLDVGPRHAAALVATAAAAELRVEHHRWTPASRSTARASGVAR